jgi:16S rRNA (guanine527-N7)-methyltransferase
MRNNEANASRGERTQALLAQEAARATLVLSDSIVTALTHFITELSRWARRLRIVGTTDLRTLMQRHVIDSFFLARFIPMTKGWRCLDVGAGAGLPGLPFAILRRDCQLMLIEPDRKRVAFLRTMIAELNLAVTVCETKIEAQGASPTLLSGYDFAWSRATWSPAEWFVKGEPLLQQEGQLIFFLSDKQHQALQLPDARWTLTHRLPYTLADGTQRWLLSAQRSGS